MVARQITYKNQADDHGHVWPHSAIASTGAGIDPLRSELFS